RMRFLYWTWKRLDARERDEASREARLVLAPDREHRLQVLLAPRSLGGEGDAERFELGTQIADADAEDQPASRKLVERVQLLGHQQGISLRQDDDPGTEANRGGVRRGEREPDRRVEHRNVRRHGGRRTLRIGKDDVLARPQALEAGGLR